MNNMVKINLRILMLFGWMGLPTAFAEGEIERKAEIVGATWSLAFRYSTNMPLLYDLENHVFLAEVKKLGPVPKPLPDIGKRRFQEGFLEVIETLHAAPGVDFSALKTLEVSGCEGLRVGDVVVVFVDSEAENGIFVVNHHPGCSSSLGPVLASRKDYDKLDEGSEAKRFVKLVKSQFKSLFDLSPEDLEAWAHYDPQGTLNQFLSKYRREQEKAGSQ